ncbi:MAG: hypothetical protein QOI31_3121 [Solirubrobacterales bacterium]|jgi:hypothetical protein|nr:hypothetical protein [Solirubrobacterales bacterium]
MSRRFGLRVLAVTAVSFALIASPSFGQAASLSGETFESVGPTQPTTFDSFTCNANGTTTFTFHTQGSAFGPYSGTFTETGSFTVGPQTNTTIDSRGVGPILNFQATFTISSVFPAGTVTGTKHLSPTTPTTATLAAFGICDPDAATPPTDVAAIVSDPFVLYDAQINAATGTRTDSGTGSVFIQSVTNVASPATFQESFNSTSAPPCEDGNNGLGHGAGHPKKDNDNDTDEYC